MSVRRVRGIELSDDPTFSRKSWKVERAGWIGLAVFLAAAFVGVLGPGLFSEVRKVDALGRFQAIYERFGHFRSDATLHVVARAEGGEASVWIGDRYLEDVEITSIRPEPLKVRAEGDGTTYLFATGGGEGSVDVRFEITYQKAGVVKGRLGRSRDDAVAIRHFVYP